MILAVFPSGLRKIIFGKSAASAALVDGHASEQKRPLARIILAKKPHAVIINRKSAKAVGLTFPTALLVRADEVIK